MLIIALRIVMQDTHAPAVAAVADQRNIAVFPLATPFIAGPATIMAVVLLTDNNVYTVWQQITTSLVLLLVLAVTYACLIGADLIQRGARANRRQCGQPHHGIDLGGSRHPGDHQRPARA